MHNITSQGKNATYLKRCRLKYSFQTLLEFSKVNLKSIVGQIQLLTEYPKYYTLLFYGFLNDIHS